MIETASLSHQSERQPAAIILWLRQIGEAEVFSDDKTEFFLPPHRAGQVSARKLLDDDPGAFGPG